jgi:4-amino-4-deoxy-L-arabinose transferase-like glycosyltransferase
MESPLTDPSERALRASDYGWLLLLCGALFGFSLVQPRVFTTHETVHCQNVREMFTSGGWFIPTYGGRPWLERPPAPHWLTGICAAVTGGFDHEWSMRLGSILIATLAVLVFAWAVAGCLGRGTGLMSGAVLATTREFAAYAVGPEADIFLASTVTIAGSLFLRMQFGPDAILDGPATFFGRRGPRLLAFFLLLGLTNWMKGPLFGMIFVLLPAGGYFLWSRRAREIRPYLWFWGWLILLAAGASWPVLAYLRYPDITELWAVDYGVRWQSGYIGEPFWYYLVQQPWNLFPWTIGVVVGLAVTARAVRDGASPALRFLWCWALLPVAFFSLFKGKHHHYMLSCLAPAAALGAVGTVHLWRKIIDGPAWLRRVWPPLLLVGLPGAVVIAVFGAKIPGPGWVRWAAVAGMPCVVFAACWSATRRRGRLAFAGFFALVVAVNCLAYTHRSLYLDSYVADRAFVEEVKAAAEPRTPLLVVFDEHPLNSSWLLYYLGENARLLHNLTFLRDDRIAAPEAFVVCRQRDESALTEYGVAERVAQSAKARGELSPGDRWTLYRLRFHPHLARMPGDVRISPLQATGRQPGPFLGRSFAAGKAQ